MHRSLARRLKEIAVNCGLAVGSLLIFLLFCEFVLFRFVLLPTDLPLNTFANDLVRYVPYQTGVWRVRNEVASRYAINAQGWNSGIASYAIERNPGVVRVAIVGDSYVEGFQVPNDRSIGERLAVELSRDGRPVEVYRFGMTGAPLSQYLHMIEREVVRYRPDWIVVLLIHNDFDESFRFVQGRYTSSFLKLRVAEGKVVEEIAPTPWRGHEVDWLRRTATARCLYYRWGLNIRGVRDFFLGTEAHAATPRYEGKIDVNYEANINVKAVLREMSGIEAAVDHVFGRMANVARRNGAGLLLSIDGVRRAIYADGSSPVLALNRLSAELAQRHDIAFIDLDPVFRSEWKARRRMFEYPSDNHWNEHGHATAASAVARALDPQL